jgi:hypothetical protein
VSNLRLSAPKGSKCLCDKRAKSTLMSWDGAREIAHLCMKCGLMAQMVMQRYTADRDSPSPTKNEDPNLRDFVINDAGLSSRTLVSVLVPALRDVCRAHNGSFGLGDFPYDPADFGRCYRALKLIPGGIERLHEVSNAYPEWTGLVDNWEELTQLYELELPKGTAPRLYQRMKELRV